MRKAIALFSLAAFSALMLGACGGNSIMSQNPPGGPAMAPASLTIHDNPPAGVIVLSFEITVTGASLQPSDTSKPAVAMVREPEEIELEHLQAESALLANLSVPAGTYNSLSVSFANPHMTILNQSGAPLSLPNGQSCGIGQACEFAPKLNQSMVTVQAPMAPFPITLSANSPLALDLDFNVNTSIQAGDLSITPAVTVKQLATPPGDEMEGMHFVGRISAIDATNKTFTLQLGFTGTSMTIATDTNTAFNFDGVCAANNFSCLMMGEVVSVLAQLTAPGTTPLAKEVELFAPENELALIGLVSKVDVAQNQFQIVIRDLFDENNQMSSIPMGLVITVQILPEANPLATFSIDSDGMTLPAGLNFASLSDMVIGQAVQIHPIVPITITGAPPNVSITVGTDKVRLEPSPVTATITAINASANPPNFTLGSLPMFFTANGITAIQVDVLTTTQFFNDATGLAGLSTGNTVSVGGLLFNTTGTPTLVAEKVLLRTP